MAAGLFIFTYQKEKDGKEMGGFFASLVVGESAGVNDQTFPCRIHPNHFVNAPFFGYVMNERDMFVCLPLRL